MCFFLFLYFVFIDIFRCLLKFCYFRFFIHVAIARKSIFQNRFFRKKKKEIKRWLFLFSKREISFSDENFRKCSFDDFFFSPSSITFLEKRNFWFENYIKSNLYNSLQRSRWIWNKKKKNLKLSIKRVLLLKQTQQKRES